MKPMRLPPLLPADPDAPFPPADSALREPDGLLAIGGDLAPARLLNAYRHGIFPWYSEGQPILWWSPDPRMLLRTDGVRLSSRFRRWLRRSEWTLRADTDFAAVIRACAQAPRRGQHGTWITAEMEAAYLALHRLGHAHSVEVYDSERLVGGIYGVAVGRMFFGESMFSGASGGSKVALASLARYLRGQDWPLIDAQVENAHLVRMGALPSPRTEFLAEVAALTRQPGHEGSWADTFGCQAASALAAGPAASAQR